MNICFDNKSRLVNIFWSDKVPEGGEISESWENDCFHKCDKYRGTIWGIKKKKNQKLKLRFIIGKKDLF